MVVIVVAENGVEEEEEEEEEFGVILVEEIPVTAVVSDIFWLAVVLCGTMGNVEEAAGVNESVDNEV